MPLVIECGSVCGRPEPVIVQIPGPPGTGTIVNPIVTYTSGTPPNPLYVNLPAMAYDPTGNLPTMGWNVSTQTWT